MLYYKQKNFNTEALRHKGTEDTIPEARRLLSQRLGDTEVVITEARRHRGTEVVITEIRRHRGTEVVITEAWRHRGTEIQRFFE